MFLSPYRMMDMYQDAMRIRNKDFQIAATVTVIIDNDVQRALDQIKQNVGFYVGGMGAKSFNVHKDHVSRMGFGAEADRVQELFFRRPSRRSDRRRTGRTVRRDFAGGAERAHPRTSGGVERQPRDHVEHRQREPGYAAFHGRRVALNKARRSLCAI